MYSMLYVSSTPLRGLTEKAETFRDGSTLCVFPEVLFDSIRF